MNLGLHRMSRMSRGLMYVLMYKRLLETKHKGTCDVRKSLKNKQ